jgi:hypothetical protein
MTRNNIRLVIFVTFLIAVVLISQHAVQAQTAGNTWTPYVDVSNTPTASTFPGIAADAAGNVHVVWSEDVGGVTKELQYNSDGSIHYDALGKPVNTLVHAGQVLFYTRWNGQKWLNPIDVQINPYGVINYPKATVDRNGILHVIWVAGEGARARLAYSKVVATRAESAGEWSKPAMLADPVLYAYYPMDIVSDPSGGIHVVYSDIGTEPGAYVINSFDGGNTWSAPVELYRTYDVGGSQEGVSTMRLNIDGKGRLHATWSRYGADGNGKAIYYSQSNDLGRTWSKPFEVATCEPCGYEVDWLNAGVVGDEIHLVWEDTSTIAERISTDGGRTWTGQQQILSKLRGENGFADMVVDSANHLHLLIVKRGDAGTIAHGVWYTVWENGHWRDPILLGIANTNIYSQLGQLSSTSLQDMTRGTINGNGLRYQQSTIVNGNQLFVVVVNEWDGDIWSTYATLSAPFISPKPYPQPMAAPAQVLTSTLQVTPTVASSQPIITNGVLGNQDSRTGDPIILGSLPVLVLIVGTVILIRIARRSPN